MSAWFSCARIGFRVFLHSNSDHVYVLVGTSDECLVFLRSDSDHVYVLVGTSDKQKSRDYYATIFTCPQDDALLHRYSNSICTSDRTCRRPRNAKGPHPEQGLLIRTAANPSLQPLTQRRKLQQRQLLAQLFCLKVAQQPPILCSKHIPVSASTKDGQLHLVQMSRCAVHTTKAIPLRPKGIHGSQCQRRMRRV